MPIGERIRRIDDDIPEVQKEALTSQFTTNAIGEVISQKIIDPEDTIVNLFCSQKKNSSGTVKPGLGAKHPKEFSETFSERGQIVTTVSREEGSSITNGRYTTPSCLNVSSSDVRHKVFGCNRDVALTGYYKSSDATLISWKSQEYIYMQVEPMTPVVVQDQSLGNTYTRKRGISNTSKVRCGLNSHGDMLENLTPAHKGIQLWAHQYQPISARSVSYKENYGKISMQKRNEFTCSVPGTASIFTVREHKEDHGFSKFVEETRRNGLETEKISDWFHLCYIALILFYERNTSLSKQKRIFKNLDVLNKRFCIVIVAVANIHKCDVPTTLMIVGFKRRKMWSNRDFTTSEKTKYCAAPSSEAHVCNLKLTHITRYGIVLSSTNDYDQGFGASIKMKLLQLRSSFLSEHSSSSGALSYHCSSSGIHPFFFHCSHLGTRVQRCFIDGYVLINAGKCRMNLNDRFFWEVKTSCRRSCHEKTISELCCRFVDHQIMLFERETWPLHWHLEGTYPSASIKVSSALKKAEICEMEKNIGLRGLTRLCELIFRCDNCKKNTLLNPCMDYSTKLKKQQQNSHWVQSGSCIKSEDINAKEEDKGALVGGICEISKFETYIQVLTCFHAKLSGCNNCAEYELLSTGDGSARVLMTVWNSSLEYENSDKESDKIDDVEPDVKTFEDRFHKFFSTSDLRFLKLRISTKYGDAVFGRSNGQENQWLDSADVSANLYQRMRNLKLKREHFVKKAAKTQEDKVNEDTFEDLVTPMDIAFSSSNDEEILNFGRVRNHKKIQDELNDGIFADIIAIIQQSETCVEQGVKLGHLTNLCEIGFQSHDCMMILGDYDPLNTNIEVEEQHKDLKCEQEDRNKDPEEINELTSDENHKVISNDDDSGFEKSAEGKTFGLDEPFFKHHFGDLVDNISMLSDIFTCCDASSDRIVSTKVHEEPISVKNMQPPKIRSTGRMRDNLVRSFTFASISPRTSRFSTESFAEAGFYVANGDILTCFSCQIQHNIRDIAGLAPENPRWHNSGCEAIGRSSSSVRRLPDVESDGRVSDNVGDAPGQQSIYIPPGDVRREDYRLSTFEKFPVSCPISRKSLSRSGFYFTGFVDRVKCFACGRTVERWEATDNPAELRWHKPSCPLPRGGDCDNVPIMNLFSSVSAPRQGQEEQVLEQRDTETGALIRRIRYPANLPERIRSGGGTFEIGEGNSVIIRSAPGSRDNPVVRVGNESVQQPPVRQWRMANVVSGDVRRFLNNLHLNRELDRVASFARWPIGTPTISPAYLAKSGFFYLGDMDRTQCFSCGGVLRNWTLNDDAFAEHRSHFPQCRMVRRTEPRNVEVPEHPETLQERETNYPCRFPVNPHMRSEASRLETFDHRWLTDRTSATPAEIAQAGFFYLGERDRVKCWYCNGGLQNWDYDDLPWVEHARWFPVCQFLLRVKGQHFSYRHLSLRPHLARPIIAKQQGSPLDPGSQVQASGSQDIPPSTSGTSAPAPPPTIIDPREEMKKRKERVKNVMKNSDVVKNVLTMGFDENIVEALLEDRVNSGTEANPDDIYEGVSELLNDVMKKEEEQKREEEARSSQASANAAVATAAAGPGSFGTVSSVYSSMPGASFMSSLGPAPGSGKYNVSFYDMDEDDDKMNEDMYGSTAATSAKQLAGTEDTLGSLQEAMNKIEDERMCKICFSNPADMVFIPCSHMVCCMECTQAIHDCPVCRKKIEKALKTYTS